MINHTQSQYVNLHKCKGGLVHVLVRLTPFTCHRLCVNLPCNLSALISASTHNEKPQSLLYTYIYFSPPSAPLCLHLLVCAPLPLPASAHVHFLYVMSKCLSALQAISRCLTAIRQEAEPPSPPPPLLLIFLPHAPEERQLLSENQFFALQSAATHCFIQSCV